jgi:hypothetical protein
MRNRKGCDDACDRGVEVSVCIMFSHTASAFHKWESRAVNPIVTPTAWQPTLSAAADGGQGTHFFGLLAKIKMKGCGTRPS